MLIARNADADVAREILGRGFTFVGIASGAVEEFSNAQVAVHNGMSPERAYTEATGRCGFTTTLGVGGSAAAGAVLVAAGVGTGGAAFAAAGFGATLSYVGKKTGAEEWAGRVLYNSTMAYGQSMMQYPNATIP